MFADPLFIFSLAGMLGCIYVWIRQNIAKAKFNPLIEENLSSLGTIFFFAMIMSIWFNSGDLGLILFIAVIIKNTVEKCKKNVKKLRDGSGTFLGHFRDKSGTFPGQVRDILVGFLFFLWVL